MSNHMCPWHVLLGLTDSRPGERREREGARQKDRERQSEMMREQEHTAAAERH